jgi:hypothetical protein
MHDTHTFLAASQKGVAGELEQSSFEWQLGTQRCASRSHVQPATPQFSELMHSTHAPPTTSQYGTLLPHCASFTQLTHECVAAQNGAPVPAQFVLDKHWTQRPSAGTQYGTGRAHCSDVLHSVSPLVPAMLSTGAPAMPPTPAPLCPAWPATPGAPPDSAL